MTELFMDRPDLNLRLSVDFGVIVISLETVVECFRDFRDTPASSGKGGYAPSLTKVDFLLPAGSIW